MPDRSTLPHAPTTSPAPTPTPTSQRFSRRMPNNRRGKNVAVEPSSGDDLSRKELLLETENGSAEAKYVLSECYASGSEGFSQNMPRALKLRKAAAKGGNPQAQYTLGCAYDKGSMGVEQDKKKAAKWWGEATQGCQPATMELSGCFWAGKDVEKDHQKASELVRSVAVPPHKERS